MAGQRAQVWLHGIQGCAKGAEGGHFPTNQRAIKRANHVLSTNESPPGVRQSNFCAAQSDSFVLFHWVSIGNFGLSAGNWELGTGVQAEASVREGASKFPRELAGGQFEHFADLPLQQLGSRSP